VAYVILSDGTQSVRDEKIESGSDKPQHENIMDSIRIQYVVPLMVGSENSVCSGVAN